MWSPLRVRRLAQRLERVRGDEQPDRFLLRGEQLWLLELDRRDRRVQRAREAERAAGGCLCSRGCVFLQIEDRALPDLRVLLQLLACPLGLLEDFEHPLAGRAGGAERAALDQRLDRLLVDRAVVDALAEVPDRAEWAGGLRISARPFDRLDGLVADALDGVEAEADVAIDDGELVV
jgi:hypothetical protein